MSYYGSPMGDYKTYGYAGDPGFLSSLWRGVKKIARFIPGPIGTIAAAVGGAAALTKFTPPIVRQVAPAIPRYMENQFFPGTGLPARPGGYGPSGAMPRAGAAAGALCLPGPPGPTRGSVMPTNGCCPVGYHLDKATKAYCVRNRRMNIANPRALRRGMRRVQGFEKLAKRTISFTRRVKLKK